MDNEMRKEMFRDPRTDLINLPFVRACIVKWNEGERVHGVPFKGRPLPHAFEEYVDATNYLDQEEIMATGTDPDDAADRQSVREMTMACALTIQLVHRRRQARMAAGQRRDS